MRELFLTTTRPAHKFRSERKLFGVFWRLRQHRHVVRFGNRSRNSMYKTMLGFKRFLLWYYGIRSFRFWKKLFTKSFLKRRGSYRFFGLFLHLIECSLFSILVRSGYSTGYSEAISLIRSNQVFVNGVKVNIAFFSLGIGDIIEFSPTYFYYAVWLPVVFLSRTFFAFRRRYFYYTRLFQSHRAWGWRNRFLKLRFLPLCEKRCNLLPFFTYSSYNGVINY